MQKWFGYVNEKNEIYLTAYCSDYQCQDLKNKKFCNDNFIAEFIEPFEAKNKDKAYEKARLNYLWRN